MRHLLYIRGLKHRAYQFLYMVLSLTLLQLYSVTQLNVGYTVWLSSMSVIQGDSAQCQLLIQNFFNRPPGPICFKVCGQHQTAHSKRHTANGTQQTAHSKQHTAHSRERWRCI